jgi:hypothetical protein
MASRWVVVVVMALAAGPAWAGKKAPVDGPTPEVAAAYEGYGQVAKAYSDAYRAADASALQQLVWGLCAGSTFQPRVDALAADVAKAEARMMAASQAVSQASSTGDVAGMTAASDALKADLAGLGALTAAAAALKADLEAAAANQPKTIALSALATTEGSVLQCLFATAGWKQEGAGVGGMRSGAYLSENFDVAQGGKVLNVSVLRPSPGPGMGAATPKQLAAAAKPDTVFRFDPATDVFVEIRAKENATAADAKALMALVITP